MINRQAAQRLLDDLAAYPVVALVGPRQVVKTPANVSERGLAGMDERVVPLTIRSSLL